MASLNVLKLCVGASSIDDLQAFVAARLAQGRLHMHVTRQTPRRGAEIVGGGSLYWVIKGQIACRQRIVELREVTDNEGRAACGIVLDPEIVKVMPRPRAAFQGWRYLDSADAPPDLKDSAGDLPEDLARELAELGLL